MNVRVKALRYWKSDHTAESCEDAVADNAGQGLFAVADGVGTAAYAAMWSRILVEQFTKLPLLSDDPFEVAWWLRCCQAAFEEQRPPIDSLPRFAQEKARMGSHSTLVALRIVRLEGALAHAELLAIGDSCAFLRTQVTGSIQPFPIHDCADLDLPPVCLPTRFLDFDYDFHRVHRYPVTLHPGDAVILATDKVSQWLWCAGAEPLAARAEQFARVQAVASDDEWASLVEELRDRHLMRDDDATALVLQFCEDSSAAPLGEYSKPAESDISQRREQFFAAATEENGEQIAIIYGDGQILKSSVAITQLELDRSRQIAVGKKRVASALAAALRRNQTVATVVGPVWDEFAAVLMEDPASANLRTSLKSQGIDLTSYLSPASATYSELRDAILAGDDETITRCFEVIETSGIQISDAERSRVSQAQAHLYSLRSFRTALKTGDERAIFAVYERDLVNDNCLTAEEHEQARIAQRCIEMDRQLRQALDTDDDAKIAAAYQPDLQRPWMSLSPERQARIERAVTAMKARQEIEAIVASGDVVAIADLTSYTLQQGWSLTHLSPEQREQVDVARSCVAALDVFRSALASDSDEDIVLAYKPILARYPVLNPTEQERLALAQHREDKRRSLHSALEADDSRAIAAAYDPALVNSKSFSDSERQKIELACAAVEAMQRMEEAIASGNDLTILYCLNPVFFACNLLTSGQSAQVLQALQRMELLWRLMAAGNTNSAPELGRLLEQADSEFFDRISVMLDEQAVRRLRTALQSTPKVKRSLKERLMLGHR